MTPHLSAACADARAAEFPHLTGVYLNAASYGPLPLRSLSASRAYEERRAAAGLRTPADFGEVLVRARHVCARLLGTDASDIALVPNTSVGLNVAASIVRRAAREGRRTVVLPDREFPANVYPWLALERAGDVRVDIVPADADGLPDEDALCARVAAGDVVALSISAVQFATGYRADLERLGRVCSEHGALFIVDGIQALGAVPVDVRRARIDVLSCGGQKWLCSPYGTGLVYVRRGIVDRFEPELPGWLSFRATADYTQLLSYDYELWDEARRFEVGTLPIQAFIGFIESLELIVDIGVDAIFEHVRALHEPLRHWATQADADIVGGADVAHGSCILPVAVPDTERLHAALAEAGVTCVPREGAIRFSPHFYNTMDEMEQVARILRGSLN